MNWFTSFRRSKRKNFYHMVLFVCGIFLGYITTTVFYGWAVQPTRTCTFHRTIYTFYKNESECNLKLPSSNEDLILIGVLITKKDIKLANAIYNTWGANIPGKVIFFSNEVLNDTVEWTDELPIVTLLHIEVLVSPKANLEVFKYMHDAYLNSFQYFMQIPPQSYITVENLKQILLSINKGVKRMHSQNTYCVKGNKPIVSKNVLAIGYPFLEKCLLQLSILNIFSDMDISRCMANYVDLECLTPDEVNPLFYKTERKDFTYFQIEDEKVFDRSVLIYPIPDHLCMYHMHEYSQSVEIKRRESSLLRALREVNTLMYNSEYENLTPDNVPSLGDSKEGFFVDHLGMDNEILEKLRFGEDLSLFEDPFTHQEQLWNCIFRKEKDVQGFIAESKAKAKGMLHYLLDFLVNVVNRNQEESSKKRLTKKPLVHSSFRHCPFYGVQYIVDATLLGERKHEVYRQHQIIQVPFGPLYIREPTLNYIEASKYEMFTERSEAQEDQYGLQLNYDTNYLYTDDVPVPETVFFILALSGRNNNFQRFISNYEEEILLEKENAVLTIVLYGPDLESRQKVKDIVSELTTKYSNSIMIIVEGTTTNSKATALEQGSSLSAPDDLIFFIDVDMVLKADLLDRVRWLTIAGEQIYYPIVFTEYNPEMTRNVVIGADYDHFKYDQESGHWRVYGYGMVSIYYSDLLKVGGFNTTIVGWGVEDIDLYHKVERDRTYRILRCPDPGLVHVFHDKICDKDLDHLRGVMCYSSLIGCFASNKVLYNFTNSHEGIFEFAKKQQIAYENKKRKKVVAKNRKSKNVLKIVKKFGRGRSPK